MAIPFLPLHATFLRLHHPLAKYEERDNIIREQWVKAMEARIVREELQKCHRAEGVNQQENCKWLAEKYLEKLEGSRVRGHGFRVGVRWD